MGLDQSLFRKAGPGEDDFEEVAYWRKANQIHHWMEAHLNGGNSTNVEHLAINLEQLAGLRQTCQRVLDDPSLAQELLPPKDGYFFGSVEVDDRYLEQLRYTIKVIDEVMAHEAALSPPGSGQYYYWSWW